MMWQVKMIDEARTDFQKLDRSLQKQVLKGLLKVSQNPMPRPDGYGKPLGRRNGNRLTGFFKYGNDFFEDLFENFLNPYM